MMANRGGRKLKDKVALVGKMGSGKDTVADIFEKNGYVKLAIADEIKRLAEKHTEDFESYHIYKDVQKLIEIGNISRKQKDAFFWDIVHLFKTVPVVEGKNRELLQELGELGRLYNQHLWLLVIQDKIDKLLNDGYSVVISDVRTVQEAIWFKERYFYIIKIGRDRDKRVASLKKRGDIVNSDRLSHFTEKEVDYISDFHWHINNNELSFQDLEKKICKRFNFL